MNLDIGYHLVDEDAVDEVGVFDERMSIVEFLRRVEREEKLPYDMTVYGLDDLLYGADDSEEVAEYVHVILRDRVNFLSFHNYRIQFVADSVEYWEEPVITDGDERIPLNPIFHGGLEQQAPGVFSSNLNLQS